MRCALVILALWLSLPLSVTAQQADDAAKETIQQAPPAHSVPADAEPETPPAKVPAPADAEPVKPKALQSTAERPATGVGLGKMALSLLIVVAIVIALGWTFKKLTLRLPGSRHIKIISTMPLGPKERLLVIEMQGKQRVLGVTANNINLLFELENPLPEEKLASDFHTQLQSLLKK